jgi:hypothetical protein
MTINVSQMFGSPKFASDAPDASDQAKLRPNPCRTRYQDSPWCTQLQILDLYVLELDPLNFHNFLNFHQPKACFLPDRQKVPYFTL